MKPGKANLAFDAKLRPKGRPSLATLSAHLGLSPAAISRVLNHTAAAKAIPKETQDRIFAAAREFNYRPNAVARSLRHGRSMTIGVLVPEVSDGYTTLVLSGLEKGLLQAGYFYILISHHHRPELLEQAQAMLAERSVDGIVAIDTMTPLHLPLPTVAISCPAQERVTHIGLNQRRAANLAMDHLVGLGHRKIAVLKGQDFSSDTVPRWNAIRAAAAKAKVTIHRSLVAQLEGDDAGHEPGYFAAQRLLASGEAFTAMFCFNDVSAIGAIRALRETGLRVPQDVSVIGFDDVQSAAYQNPSLTTVRQPLGRMGMLAAEALIRQILGPGDHEVAKQIMVDPELVVRGSTGPVPTASGEKRRRNAFGG